MCSPGAGIMKELVKRPAQMLAMPLLLALAVIAVRPSLAGSATKWSAPMTVAADDWEQIPGDSDSGPSAPGSKPSADGVPSGDHPQRGPADAPVTIVEYSD